MDDTKKIDIEISKFKLGPATFPSFGIAFMIGKRGSGKSVALKCITNELNERRMDNGARLFSTAVVMSSTEEASPFYKGIVPDCYIYNTYRQDIIEQSINIQIKQCKQAIKMYGEEGKNRVPGLLIILDDVLYDRITHSPALRKLFYNGRHYRICVLVCLQYAVDFNINMRTQCDLVICFNDKNYITRKRLYENYFAVLPTFETFSQIMDQVCQDYTALVVNLSSRESSLSRFMFYWKASNNVPNFRFGAPEIWSAIKRKRFANFSDEEEEEEEEQDSRMAIMSKLFPARASRKVRVIQK